MNVSRGFAILVLVGSAVFAQSSFANFERGGGWDPVPSETRFDENRRGGEHRGELRGDIGYREANRLARLSYRAFLFREADRAGLQGHTEYIVNNGSSSLPDVAASFGSSEEFYNNVRPRYSSREIVRNAYRVLLNREPDQEGLRKWGQMVQRGNAAGAFYGIVGSDEFYDVQVGR